MSGVAVGAVALLVGAAIVGGILWYILQPSGGGSMGPSVTGDASGTATVVGAVSSPLPAGPLAVTGVDRRPPSGPPGECEPGRPCLRIAADGPSSVSYRLGDNTEVSCPPTCEASYPLGVSVSLYRTRGLTPEQEQGARMVRWGGDCRHLVAEAEPRGGVCELRMEDDRAVEVSFEIRPRLLVQLFGVVGYFDLSYQPEQVFAPAPMGHRLGCGAPPCNLEYFYDLGTEVTIDAGYRTPGLAQTAASLEWGGSCAGTAGWDRQHAEDSADGDPCSVVVMSDGVVTLEFGPFE